jgi:hypothetical protein
MRLPSLERAYVELARVNAYLLCDTHPDGGGKAKFFKRFGFSSSQPEAFIAALLDHPKRNDAVDVRETVWGRRYTVKCSMASPDGRNPCIVSLWQIEKNGAPRLLTAYSG